MDIQDKIEDLEQQMYIASSEGDYFSMNQLEKQLEQLRAAPSGELLDDPYATHSHWETE